MKIYYIDGYNVINSWPGLKDIKDQSYESARKELIEKIHNYSSYDGGEFYIVFDAHMVLGNLEKSDKIDKNLTVVFTKEGETADSYIEKKVNELGRRVEVYVVTSDFLEQVTIFQRGAVRISSIEFYHEVEKCQKSIKNTTEKSVKIEKNFIEDIVGDDILKKLNEMRRYK